MPWSLARTPSSMRPSAPAAMGFARASSPLAMEHPGRRTGLTFGSGGKCRCRWRLTRSRAVHPVAPLESTVGPEPILIVDDDALVLRSLGRALEGAGFTTR